MGYIRRVITSWKYIAQNFGVFQAEIMSNGFESAMHNLKKHLQLMDYEMENSDSPRGSKRK